MLEVWPEAWFLAIIFAGLVIYLLWPVKDCGRVISITDDKAIVLFDESTDPPIGDVCDIPPEISVKENDWMITETKWGKDQKIISVSEDCEREFKEPDKSVSFLAKQY